MKSFLGVYTCILFQLMTQSLSAQEQHTRLLFGIKGGVTVSDLDFDNSDINELFESKTVFSGGVFVNHYATNRLKLQVELNYVRRGIKTEIFITDYDRTTQSMGTIEYLLDYIELPVMAVIMPVEGIRAKPKLILGSQIGVNISNKVKQPELSKVGANPGLSEAEDVVFGLIIGAGFDIDFKSSLFLIDFQYFHGLSNARVLAANKYRAYSIHCGVALPI